MRVLIADDAPGIRSSLSELLKSKHETVLCEDGDVALQILEKKLIDLVITDNLMPKVGGLELIRRGKELSPSTSFVLMTAYASIDQALEAIRLGADDYFTKPFELTEILHRVNRIEELRCWKAETTLKAASRTGERLIGNSPPIHRAVEFIGKVAGDAAPILLLGPSGSGKEIIAKSIHGSGPRASRPFVAVNCASLSEQLLESELFGHEKGAFTGAMGAKPGKFELASGGTILLDEIGELSPAIQAKLLRVLQEKEFYRVGGVRQIKSDTRVIAATHRPLKEMVKAGTFREDLFFRLNVLTFELPPLSDRKQDIPLLVGFFWERLIRERGKRLTLRADTLAILTSYSFPGNVRELQNLLERLVVLAPQTGELGPDALPTEVRSAASAVPPSPTTESEEPSLLPLPDLPQGDAMGRDKGLDVLLEEYERALIFQAMEKSRHRQNKAAELLKVTRGALQYKLKKYGYYDSKGAETEDGNEGERAA